MNNKHPVLWSAPDGGSFKPLLTGGFRYLVAVMDWYSPYVLTWRLLNPLKTSFCFDTLDEEILISVPEIFNSDLGRQFTSLEFVSRFLGLRIRVSYDDRGGCFDNILNERWWRNSQIRGCLFDGLPTAAEDENRTGQLFCLLQWRASASISLGADARIGVPERKNREPIFTVFFFRKVGLTRRRTLHLNVS